MTLSRQCSSTLSIEARTLRVGDAALQAFCKHFDTHQCGEFCPAMGLVSIDGYHDSLILTVLDNPGAFTNDVVKAVNDRLVELRVNKETVRSRHPPALAAFFDVCSGQHLAKSGMPDELTGRVSQGHDIEDDTIWYQCKTELLQTNHFMKVRLHPVLPRGRHLMVASRE